MIRQFDNTTKEYSQSAVSELYLKMLNQPTYGNYKFDLDIFNPYQCGILSTVSNCQYNFNETFCNTSLADYTSNNTTLLSGSYKMEARMYFDKEKCNKNNTVIILYDGHDNEQNNNIWQKIIIVIILICVVGYVGIKYSVEDDEKQDDYEDDMNGILYKGAEMQLASEKVVEGSDWEEGGQDI